MKKKKLKFFTIKVLAKHLLISEDFLLSLKRNHRYDYYHRARVTRGKKRELYDAKPKLKKVLKQIDKKILDVIPLPDQFQGGIKGKSLRTNAERHVKKQAILKIDIKDFFPSISPDKVFKAFKKLQWSDECAEIISILTTVREPSPHLPQGFSTSPKVAALVLIDFERRLHYLAERYNWKYTFWVDDITISGNLPVLKFKNTIVKILKSEGFDVRSNKIDTLTSNMQLIVNSVVVNQFPNIPRKKRNEIKDELYYIQKFGPRNHLSRKGIAATEESIIKLKNHLLGNIHFVMGINKNLGNKYKNDFLSINWAE